MTPGIRYIIDGVKRAQFGLKPARGSFAVGCVMPDGMVVELGGEGRSWPDEEAFHEATGGMEARLLEHHAGSGGYFGTGVVLTSGAVAELGGKMRSWPCAEAFLHDAGDMDADLVRWCPPG